jgi:hypothetical protein
MSKENLPEKLGPYTGKTLVWDNPDTGLSFSVHTTLPVDTENDRRRVIDLLEGECLEGGSMIGSTMEVSDYIIHEVTKTDEETGEVVTFPRSIFIQPDGTAVSFGSDGVLKSLARLCWMRGTTPPFNPPIKVKITQRALKGGRRTFKLLPVGD